VSYPRLGHIKQKKFALHYVDIMVGTHDARHEACLSEAKNRLWCNRTRGYKKIATVYSDSKNLSNV